VLYYNNDSYVPIMTCGDSNFNSDLERITFAWYQLVILFVFPVVVMCFCYSFVVAVLWTSTKEHARLTQQTSIEPSTAAPGTAADDRYVTSHRQGCSPKEKVGGA